MITSRMFTDVGHDQRAGLALVGVDRADEPVAAGRRRGEGRLPFLVGLREGHERARDPGDVEVVRWPDPLAGVVDQHDAHLAGVHHDRRRMEAQVDAGGDRDLLDAVDGSRRSLSQDAAAC